MPRLSGIDAARAVARPKVANPVPVIIVTTFDNDAYVESALEAGVTGFILKDSGPTGLVEAVKAAANGEALVPPAITVRLLQRVSRARPSPATHSLTAREVVIAPAVAFGLTNAEIAEKLVSSLSTVMGHVASIRATLDARNRVEVAAWASRSGLC